MTINITNSTDVIFSFDYEALIERVVNGAIDFLECPYESTVDIEIVYNDQIKEINGEFRDIHKATDVLSFPVIDFDEPCDYAMLDLDESTYCFEPDSGELMLGDIILSADKIFEQAKEYGHSVEREMAFLVAHSMLHLFGFDHMEDDEREEMEKLQKQLLDELGITRDEPFNGEVKSARVAVDNETLINEAKLAMNKAYAPYSNFKVGAAIATPTGQIFTGCNVENASYGATVCAERCAAVKAVSSGYSDFTKIAIVSSLGEFTYPCGICRQFLSEFSDELIFVLSNDKGETKEVSIKELLPETFSL